VPIAPPGQEGWTRHQENVAKHPIMERTGWWFWIEGFYLENTLATTPSAPSAQLPLLARRGD